MKTRILVVDDEHEICQILSEVLQEEGFEVLIAHTADEFCMQALARLPHLIILDINLGNASGPDVYRNLLFKGLNPSTPVIFLSALVPEESCKHDMLSTGRKFLMHAKPFHHDKLLQDIRRLTENPNAEAV